MSKSRINANVDSYLYEQVQQILKARNLTVTAFIENSMKDFLKKESYYHDKEAFDNLALEEATKDMLAVESECANDGL